jgi:hypothetical protein
MSRDIVHTCLGTSFHVRPPPVAGSRHRARVKEVTFTESSNRERAYNTRAAISLGWVHAFPDAFGPQGRSLLELELKSLKLKGDRLVAPTGGPIRTKDAADCLMVLVHELLKDQLQRRPRRERLSVPLAAGAQGGFDARWKPLSQTNRRVSQLVAWRLPASEELLRPVLRRDAEPAVAGRCHSMAPGGRFGATSARLYRYAVVRLGRLAPGRSASFPRGGLAGRSRSECCLMLLGQPSCDRRKPIA